MALCFLILLMAFVFWLLEDSRDGATAVPKKLLLAVLLLAILEQLSP